MHRNSGRLRRITACGAAVVTAGLLTAGAAGAQPTTAPAVPPGSFSAVSCPTTTFCVAVGSNGTSTLVDVRTDTGWHRTKPRTRSYVGLGGVSCPTTTFCMAVGSTTDSEGTNVATSLIDRKSTWSPRSVPAPAGAYQPGLFGVSCVSATRCVAVGQYSTGTRSAALLPFADVWNGTQWTLSTMPVPVPVPVTGSTVVQALAVSCATKNSCTAVGEAHAGTGDPDVPLIEVFDGSGWTLATGVPGPGVLLAVSCSSATTCLAAGHVGDDAALAETSAAGQWSASTPPGVAVAAADPAGADCHPAGTCTVVGSQSGTGHVATFVGTLAAGAWTTASPAGVSDYPHLTAVSCVSTTFCVAVGYDDGGAGFGRLSEAWNGSVWTLETS